MKQIITKYEIEQLVKYNSVENDHDKIGFIESIKIGKDGIGYMIDNILVLENEIISSYTKDIVKKRRTRKKATEEIPFVVKSHSRKTPDITTAD